MVVKVKPEQLDEAIRGQLETYSAEITKNINENLFQSTPPEGSDSKNRQ